MGNIKKDQYYWKPLSKLFLQYIDHSESKFEGDIILLQRSHLSTTKDIRIGKEAKQNIITMTPKQKGIRRQTLHKIKNKIQKVPLREIKAVKKLLH